MKAHRTDIVSLAFGLIFLGLAAWWLLAQLLGLALPPVGWFLAGALFLIGLLGLVGALRSGRSARTTTAGATAPDPVGPDATLGGTDPVQPTSVPPAPDPYGGGDRPAGEVDPTRWDLDRVGSADDPAAWGERRSDWGDRPEWGGRAEWDVSAPVSGESTWRGATAGSRAGDGADERPTVADEWPTEAVTDARAEAIEEHAADESGPVRPADGSPAGEERPRG